MTAVPSTPDGHTWPSQLNALAGAPASEWLQQGRAQQLGGHTDVALAIFEQAAIRFPDNADVRLGLAGLRWQSGRHDQAERGLRDWLGAHPGDAAATFLLAQLLRDQGRLQAAVEAMRQCFLQGPQDTETVIQAVEMLDDFGRPHDASAICEAALTGGLDDPRLHAYAGMLAIQLGKFADVREHYAMALAQHPDAVTWNIPLGLAGLQRYTDPLHPDLAFFREILQRPDLDEPTRSKTLFALGKAYDDLGDYALAADAWREANSLGRQRNSWSRKLWKRSIDARLAAPLPAATLPPSTDWTPIFIVGVPRSGTTLLAEQLARHPEVCNRGELVWLDVISQRLNSVPAGKPQPLEEAAELYAMHLRQDDAAARWYIDKQPLNLLHVDLIMTLWPHARIVHCLRDSRDTAISLWSQSFQDAAHGYAHDFADIASVIQGCGRLAAHWRERYPMAFRSVRYEDVVHAPEDTIASLAEWLGLPAALPSTWKGGSDSISTASAWQARQPIYTRSSGRWRHYAPYLPSLLSLPPG